MNTYNLGYTHNFTGFDFVNVSSYQRTWSLSDFDGDNTAVDSLRLYIHTNGDAIYQEDYLRSTYQGRFQWIGGFVYYNDTVHLDPQYTYVGTPAGYAPVSTIIGNTGAISYAGYLQGAYSFTDQWKLTVGVRSTSEERTLYGSINGVSHPQVNAWFHRTNPTAMLQYEPNKNLDLYFRYSQAFKAGIFNVSTLSPTLVKPEDVTQYELGAKTHFGPFVYLDADVYYTDYKNLQVSAVDQSPAFLR